MKGGGDRSRISGVKKILLLFSGFILLGLGLIGMALPLLPTTPFLLLSAACFGRSSRKFYVFLYCNRLFGKTLRAYRFGRGVERRIKIRAMLLTAFTIGVSLVFMVRHSLVEFSFILAVVAVIVLFHIARIKEPTKEPAQVERFSVRR